MAALLNDLGEEYTIKNGLTGSSFIVGLYNDSTDSFSDTDDLADLTSEPSDGNYARQTSVTLAASDNSGDWQADNDSQISFDVTSTTGTVDSYFIAVNFQASDTSDGSPTDHIIATGALSQSRDLSQIDTLNLAAGSVGISLS
jgi:hypothetical protein